MKTELRSSLQRRADENERSLSQEILAILQHAVSQPGTLESIEARLSKIEASQTEMLNLLKNKL